VRPVSCVSIGAILTLFARAGKFLPTPLIEASLVYEVADVAGMAAGPMRGKWHHFIARENEPERRYGLSALWRRATALRRADRRPDLRFVSRRATVAATLRFLGEGGARAPQGVVCDFPHCRPLV